jgi:decaprenyl-phosphate phosphoribosyltransferase
MDNFLLVQKHAMRNILYLKNIITLIRVKHYIKNFLILVPLIFSGSIANPVMIFNELFAFVSFCFAASFIYVINDIVDRDKDKLHPVKKNRPVASGAVTSIQAFSIALVMITASLWMASLLNIRSFFIVMAYVMTNILYSLWLKNIPVLDVSIIALGFLLRVLMGGASIDVPISRWLLLTIMTLSFYLGFAKRRNEISKVTICSETRKVLKEYSVAFLEKAMNSMMTLSVAFYALWSIDAQVVKAFNSDKLVATVPFVLIGMFKYSLIIEGDSYGDPTDVILSDKLLQLVILGYILFVFLLIYI